MLTPQTVMCLLPETERY